MTNPFALTREDPRSGRLVPIPARERVDALFASRNPRALIRSMDAQALYALVHEAGTDVAWDLLMVASGEQLQCFFDFDCWTRDEFDADRLSSWLEIVLQREDGDFAEMLDTLDPELMVLWLRERVQVYVWDEDRDLLDELDGPVVTSPCGVFALLMPDSSEESDEIELLRLLLDRVYATGVDSGHRLLQSVRLELTSDLQERAFHARSARLGDLGFVAFHEAQEIFSWRDPSAWAASARARAADAGVRPIVLSPSGRLDPMDAQLQELEVRSSSDGPSMFARALGALSAVVPAESLESVADSLLAQFRAVANRVHIADLGNPGDVDATRQSVARADAMIGLALELAAGTDAALAARILSITALRDLHQVGYSMTARLQREARRLLGRGNLTLVDGVNASLLSPGQRDLLDGLLQRRPIRSAMTGSRFETHAQIEQAAQQLGRIAFLELLFFGLLRFQRAELASLIYDTDRCATPPELVSFRSLFATMVLDAHSGRRRGLTPLSMPELERAIGALPPAEERVATLTDVGAVLVRAAARGMENTEALAMEWAAEVAGWLHDELGGSVPPPEVAAQLVVLAP